MATVERVIERLWSEKEHLLRERDRDIRDIDLALKPGGKGAKDKVRKRCYERIEVIDYVLNFLKGEEE